ncbi:hypothetical protein ElyMa_003110300 [Elysia marginata]|uniref:Uncharacterized protein n=1 Tax=Elysia marginata TaxID=1093978 RepID=A0AAV4IQB4_9GAST|nr:hypothetical protein ElyMa_003110300 [Elysia marginata]
MLELLSMLRPLTTWQMLLGVCLLDLALIAVRLSWPEESTTAAAALSQQREKRLQYRQQQLRELLAHHSDLARQVADSKRQLEENRQQLQTLMADQASMAAADAEQLRLLTRGVEDVELGVAALLAKRSGQSGSKIRQNATHAELVT